MTVSELLQEIGLTKSEIKVYLALLELGSTTTGPIVERSQASSSKIYEILEKLMQKGLVSFVIKSGTKYFESAPPRRILDYMKEKKKKLNQQENSLKQILPELELKRKLTEDKSETTVFKGIRGGETAFNDILTLKKGEELTAMGFSDIPESFQKFLLRFHRKRAAQGIKLRSMFGEKLREFGKELAKLPETKVEYYPKEFENPVAVLAYGDKSIISLPQDKLWIQIKNKRFAEANKQRFDEAWNQNTKVYRGLKGARTAFYEGLDLLTPKDEFLVFGIPSRSEKVNHFFVEYNKERKKRGIKSRQIFDESARGEIQTFAENNPLSEIKFHPSGIKTPAAINIMKDKTIIFPAETEKDPLLIVIDNKDVTDSFRAQFELLWNQDVTVTKGFKNIKETLLNFLQEMENSSYDVMGAAFGEKGLEKEYVDFFKNHHTQRIKKNTKARLLFQQGHLAHISKKFQKKYYQNTEIKTLPHQDESPVETFMGNDKTMLLIQEKKPTLITINNKEVTDSFKKNFETLWNQDTTVVKGWEAARQIFLTLMEEMKNSSYDVIGAAFGEKGLEKKYVEFFREIHPIRIKNKVSARLLFLQGHTQHIPKKYFETFYKNIEIKESPYREKSPVVKFITDKKIILFIQEKEPTVITINNKEVTESFQKNFDSLWNQKIKTYFGKEGVRTVFDDTLNFKNIWFIGGNGGIKKYFPKYWDEYSKNRLKNKVFWHDLIDKKMISILFEENKNIPYYEYKVLPPKLESPHVIMFYGNKVVNILWGKETTLTVVEDKNIVKSYKQYFDYLWSQKTDTYQGFDEIKTIREELITTLQPGDTFKVLGAPKIANLKLEAWFMEFHKKRVKNKINLEILYTQDAKKFGEKRKQLPLTEVRYFPNEFSSPNWVDIFPEAVLFVMVLEEPVAFVVKSKEIADSFRNYFKLMWSLSKK